MKETIRNYVRHLEDQTNINVVYLTLTGSYTYKTMNKDSDVDVVGFYTNNNNDKRDRITNRLFKVNNRTVGLVLYHIEELRTFLLNQSLFGYRYFNNPEYVIIPNKLLEDNVQGLYMPSRFIPSAYLFLHNELLEYQRDVKKEPPSYQWKKLRHIAQDIAAMSSYLDYLSIKDFSYRTYFNASLSAPFKMLLCKMLGNHHHIPNMYERDVIRRELFYLISKYHNKLVFNEEIPKDKINKLIDNVITLYQ